MGSRVQAKMHGHSPPRMMFINMVWGAVSIHKFFGNCSTGCQETETYLLVRSLFPTKTLNLNKYTQCGNWVEVIVCVAMSC